MTLDPRKWTTKTGEAVSAAMQVATVAGHPELTPHHVLAELLKQEGTVVAPLLTKVGVTITSLAD
ncbi:MAG: Clp protease N-terminal domain-containing protein, partial [Actinomycetota bacterium]